MALPAASKVLCTAYAMIAAFALAATWVNEGPYLHSPTAYLGTFWRDAAANGASRFLAAEALTLAMSAVVLMVIEGRRHGVRFVWAYVACGYFVAISVAFPLFLIARELRIGASEKRRPHAVDTILLAALAVFAVGLTSWVDFR